MSKEKKSGEKVVNNDKTAKNHKEKTEHTKTSTKKVDNPISEEKSSNNEVESDIMEECVSQQEFNNIKEEIETKDNKIREYEDFIKRIQADTDNIRKRLEKDKKDTIKFANKNLLSNLLNFVDDFERALQVDIEESHKNFYDGVEMIYNRVVSFIGENGVKEIECLNKEFDPNMHEAISVDENDKYKVETIIEIFQKGYTIHDDILRTPKVRIGKPTYNNEK